MKRGLLVLFALMLVVPGLAAANVQAASGNVKLHATLRGAAEVPKGDPHGKGSAILTLNAGKGQVCFTIHASHIGLPASASHIHKGRAGVAGNIVVQLIPPGKSGTSSGCIHKVKSSLIKAIEKQPSAYYVNVHNAKYPGGAIRGQLSKM